MTPPEIEELNQNLQAVTEILFPNTDRTGNFPTLAVIGNWRRDFVPLRGLRANEDRILVLNP